LYGLVVKEVKKEQLKMRVVLSGETTGTIRRGIAYRENQGETAKGSNWVWSMTQKEKEKKTTDEGRRIRKRGRG